MAADNAAAWPRDAEIPLTDVRSVPKTGLARPPPTQQTARKGRLNFLYAATHSHVAERAGISVSTVHFYFRTREDLVDAVLSAVEVQQHDLARDTLDGPGSVRDCLTALAVRFAEEARDEPDLIKVWLDWSTDVRGNLWQRYIVLNEGFNKQAQKVLARGKRDGSVSPHLNVKAAARFYIGGGHTVALMQFAGASQREFDVFIAQLVNMIMGNGLGLASKG